MKSKHPLVQVVLLILFTAAFQQPTQHLTDVPAHPWDLILTRPTASAVTASLLAYKDSEAYLEYGTSSTVYTAQTPVKSFPNNQPGNIVLSGLPANTRHYYRLRIRDVGSTEFTASQEYSFITKRPPGSTFTFTMQADSHLDENTDPLIYAQALANMRADNPDFMIDLGDTFMTDKYGTTYTDAQKQYIAQRYYFGLLCPSAPLLFTLGNHDGEQGRYLNGTTDNMTVWSNKLRKALFPNPVPNDFYTGNGTPDPIAGLPENYFAWEWGDALFLVLDPFWKSNKSGQSDNWAWTLGEAQYQWLKTTLEKSQARYRFVFLHHLVGGSDTSQRGGVEAAKFYEWGGFSANNANEFATKRPGWEMPIHQLLVKHKVTAVFHGHDHLYVKQDLDGIVYQEVPQPGFPRFNQAVSATEYGYLSGTILGGPGHLRVTVAPDEVKVDLVRPVLAKDETVTKKNRQVDHSFEIKTAFVTAAATVSAASYSGTTIAPESLASAFGVSLATNFKAATAFPLPTELEGTSVRVKDSAGTERLAPLLFVSPNQINYQIPAGTTAGKAIITILINGTAVSTGEFNVAATAPGIFSATSDGKGYAAANIQRVRNGNSTFEDVVRFDAAQGKIVPIPIDFGPATDELFLVLYGTGIRFHSGLNNVRASVGGVESEILFADKHCCYEGVDQINVRLLRSLAGRSDVDVVLIVDGKVANAVKVNFAATTNVQVTK